MAPRKSLFRKLYKLHVYLGVFVAIHFTLFALSGLPLLFKEDFISQEQGAAAPTEKREIVEAYASIYDQLRKDYPNDRVLALFPEDTNANIVNARLGVDGTTKLRGARRLSFNLAQSSGLAKENSSGSRVLEKVFDWLLVFHRELFLGSSGKIYIGFVGLAYVFMLISGFIIYGNFMKGRSFGEIRSEKILRLSDLHKFVGMVSFGWGLIVGLSGVFLAFNGVLIKLFLYGSLTHLAQAYGAQATGGDADAPFEKIVESALSAKGDAVISYISFPDTEFGVNGHYLFLINGTDRFSERISDLVVVDAKTAALREVVQLPIYLKLLLLSEPLHFGDYGGLFLKVVWAVFTLCSLAVVLLGLASFYLKRSQRREGDRVRKRDARLLKNWRLPVTARGYGVPVALGVVTLVGIIAALFAEGALTKAALGLLLIPLVPLFLLRRKRDA
mgnify:CR=1 FL=1